MHLVIALPAFNEARVIGAVLAALPRRLAGITRITPIVIDDGSTDATAAVAAQNGALVLRHKFNRGVGLATITGIKAAQQARADILVTMDSDGQHHPADIKRLVAPIIAHDADLVVGTRLLHSGGMPLARQLGNHIANALLRIIAGVKTTDSQSGFRAYSRRAIKVLRPTTTGYEICMEILIAAQKMRLRLTEVPIDVIYTSYSKRKGQTVLSAMNTLLRLLAKTAIG